MNTIKIDTSIWKRPCQMARALNTSMQNVNNMIREGKLEKWYIKELGLTLVRKR